MGLISANTARSQCGLRPVGGSVVRRRGIRREWRRGNPGKAVRAGRVRKASSPSNQAHLKQREQNHGNQRSSWRHQKAQSSEHEPQAQIERVADVAIRPVGYDFACFHFKVLDCGGPEPRRSPDAQAGANGGKDPGQDIRRAAMQR